MHIVSSHFATLPTSFHSRSLVTPGLGGALLSAVTAWTPQARLVRFLAWAWNQPCIQEALGFVGRKWSLGTIIWGLGLLTAPKVTVSGPSQSTETGTTYVRLNPHELTQTVYSSDSGLRLLKWTSSYYFLPPFCHRTGVSKTRNGAIVVPPDHSGAASTPTPHAKCSRSSHFFSTC